MLCVELLTVLKQLLTDQRFQATYRLAPHAFTRIRKLPFERVLLAVCRLTRLALQGCLNAFFKALGESQHVATASALCQARQKLHFGAFRALHRASITLFYREQTNHSLVQTWQGHRLTATDCTFLNLPNTPETRAGYIIQQNKSANERVQAMASCWYDVLNGLPLNFEVTSNRVEKQAVFTSHAAYWQPGDIHIYDRAYADYSVIAYHAHGNHHFVIRCPTGSSFRVVREFLTSPEVDRTVILGVGKRVKAWVQTKGLPQCVPVRLLKILLPTGETEVLLTSLLDASQYAHEAFSELYCFRWGVETYFDAFKHQLDVERFNSEKLNGILQEIYAMVFLSALSRLLSLPAEVDLQQRSPPTKRPRKYRHKLNQVVVYATVSLFLAELFLLPSNSLIQRLQELWHMIQQTSIPIRPNRSFPRPRLKTRQQLRYLRYKKRLWA
ncbi:MAG: IS4 family transposase [Promethearchaeota archaeon]